VEFNAGCIKNSSANAGIVPIRSNPMHSSARTHIFHAQTKRFSEQLQQAQPEQSRHDLGSRNGIAV
jgi:hypothetical protein